MTKKHFIAIAEIINTSQSKEFIAKRLAGYFKTENINFDADRFLKAAGV